MDQPSTPDARLLRRAYSEFLEMPGLRLTCRQAQRLWNLDEDTCRTILEYLTDAGFLCRPGHGVYGRLTEGDATVPHLRMAR